MQKKPKYYLTASLLNAWLKGYDSFYSMLYRIETEPNQAVLDGIAFENQAVNGEIEELRPIVDGAIYQQFVCRECEGYMLLGFCDLIKRDTIYDLKFVSTYDLGKYTDSVQHLIYLYCTDMQNFEYIIGCGKKDLEIYFEKQPRDDQKLKATIKQFITWLKMNDLLEVYQQNYSTQRYEKEIEEYENYIR